MPGIEHWHGLATAWGWVLLHSFWQVGIAYLTHGLAARWMPRRVGLRYTLAMGLMLGSWLCTCHGFYVGFRAWHAQAMLLSAPMAQSLELDPTPTMSTGAAVNTVVGRYPLDRVQHLLEGFAPYITWFWLIGVVLLCVRLMGGYWMVQRLRHRDTRPPGEALGRMFAHLRNKMRLQQRPITLLESPWVREPLTLGFWKPMILFPIGLHLRLDPPQLEALLLHELAHIRRHDYLFNLLQLLLDVWFFYHPLHLLLSRDTRRLREFCCDEVVLANDTNRMLYAKTLTDLKIHSFHHHNQFVMNSIGKDGFTQRILRIVGISPRHPYRNPWPFAALFLLIAATGPWMAFRGQQTQQTLNPLTLVWPQPIGLGSALAPLTATATPQASNPFDGVQSTEGQLFAQKNPTLETPADSARQPIIAVDATKMNIFYIGVDNPITTAVSGYDCASIKVRLIGEGSVQDKGDCQHVVVVRKPGTVQIEIYTTAQGKEQLLGTKTFRVKRIPDPSPYFGGKQGGTISRERLLSHLRESSGEPLSLLLINFDYDAGCEVVGYEMTIMPRHADPMTFRIQKMSKEQGQQRFQVISKHAEALPDSSVIFIDNIRARCPGDAATRHLGGLSLRVLDEN